MAASAMQPKQALKDAIRDICVGLEAGKEDAFWKSMESILAKFMVKNKELLLIRDNIQKQIDAWHDSHPDVTAENLGENEAYVKFLTDIGYLLPVEEVQATTSNVDPEFGSIAGPQLVCPIDKARFVLKACNARWGSLFDTVYASNLLPGDWSGPWSEARAKATFAFVDEFLDQAFPLTGCQWSGVDALALEGGKLVATSGSKKVSLQTSTQFVGYSTSPAESRYLLKNNGLHIELVVNKTTQLGRVHHASISDVLVESALTAILDMEDSVAAVDAEDKAQCYRNFAAVMRGDLQCTMENGKVRSLASEKGPYNKPDASGQFTLPGRVVALIRNVGLSMYNDMITYNGEAVPEHLVDILVTALCACHDLKRPKEQRNSKAGSVYVVKPKMHGPDEVSFVMELFEEAEKAMGLPPLTLKVGVMDEERRTTVNLQTCISRAAHRIAFINTGFLDRVGDEIHTSMHLGPFYPKMKIRAQPFLGAYEDNNVVSGLKAKFSGRAQIGKGMWAQPDNMEGLFKQKIGHPKAGANTAWVPSPVGATVHALHYHQVSVASVQNSLSLPARDVLLKKILSPPVVLNKASLTQAEIERELDENCQSILGYVVRWVDQGVGCSKVPDLNDVQLMEDRATLRISSQLCANWLRYGIISASQFEASLRKMAVIVDKQNADDKAYRPLAPAYNGPAFEAARRLVLDGEKAENGLTEPVLTTFRKQVKASQMPRSKL
jgi:malate synthase